MLVDAFREARGVSRAELETAVEKAREEAREHARREASERAQAEVAGIRAQAFAELERANALRLKAARIRRSLDAELKRLQREGGDQASREVDEARRKAVEILDAARRAAERIRKTARQAAESEVQALLADLESARLRGARQAAGGDSAADNESDGDVSAATEGAGTGDASPDRDYVGAGGDDAEIRANDKPADDAANADDDEDETGAVGQRAA
jgi:hypothetical protein